MSRRVQITVVAYFADDVTREEIDSVAVDAFAQVDDPEVDGRSLTVVRPARFDIDVQDIVE